MDCSTPGSFVLHCLLESAQIHVHRVGDAIYHRILCHPFSFCLQSFPASGSFPVSSVFSLGGQTNGALASATVLPMYIHSWFPLGLTGLIALQSKRLSRVFYNTTLRKHQFFGAHLQNTFLCILHLFPFQHLPPAPPQCCLSFRSLYGVNLMNRQTFFISICPVYLLCIVCSGGGGTFGVLADIFSCL